MTAHSARNLRGGAWLLADLSLNIWALAIVKGLGAGYPAAQVVLFRAGVGLVLIAPLIWHNRAAFRPLPDPGLHLLRVGLAALTLIASFFAIARLPLALFTAVSFTRPLVTMFLAALLLREVIGPRRWIAAGVAMAGVVIAVNPGGIEASSGLAAMAVVVVSASMVVVTTRRLRAAPTIVMMAFYTGGLTLIAAPFALVAWEPVAAGHLVPFLLIGCFAQAAQFCFLRAHFFGSAGYLSVLSYLSLIFSVGVGYLVFDEVPDLRFAMGALLVVGASLWVTLRQSEGGV